MPCGRRWPHTTKYYAGPSRLTGRVFKHTGDGVCAAFASPRCAVDAAVAAQRALQLPVRMGIATGEASEFGYMPLSALRPSQVKAWVAKLQADELEASYVYALHSRLSQILSDAAHDGVLGRNPCSRRTSPPMGKQKPYVATTEQIWQLHDAMPDHLRVAVLLGAFAGLRVAEASALRVSDVDFIRGVVTPVRQWPDKPLKTPG